MTEDFSGMKRRVAFYTHTRLTEKNSGQDLPETQAQFPASALPLVRIHTLSPGVHFSVALTYKVEILKQQLESVLEGTRQLEAGVTECEGENRSYASSTVGALRGKTRWVYCSHVLKVFVTFVFTRLGVDSSM